MVEVRMINELAYCPRLAYLMYVDGLFEHNTHTIEGTLRHSKRRRSTYKGDTTKTVAQEQKGFHLSCNTLGLTGTFDGFILDNGTVHLVEDKVGRGPTKGMLARAGLSADGDAITPPSITVSVMDKLFQLSPNAYHNDQAQVACYYLLLAANGYRCTSAHISYLGGKRRVSVEFTESLLGYTRALIAQAHTLADSPRPSPLVNSPKCAGCSLNEICLPNELNYLNSVQEEKPRRLLVPRLSAGILYVTTQGAILRKEGESISLRTPDGVSESIPLVNVSSVCLFGNVQVSTQLIRTLGKRGCAIQYLSYYGTYESVCHSPLSTNIKLRIKQFDSFGSPSTSLYLAKRIVEAKVRNQRTLLRRNIKGGSSEDLGLMRQMYLGVEGVESQESLLGVEGYAAKLYWQMFPLQFQGDEFEFNGRNRRPPKDPVNVLLSIGYTLLMRDCYIAVSSIGFDPYRGFFHSSEYKRPSLALDLMEPYRPIIVDSCVLRAINQNIVKPSDFNTYKGGCYITPAAKKKFINTYEQRLSELITHPSFGYSLSYRRILSLEARLLARYIQGDTTDYSPLVVR